MEYIDSELTSNAQPINYWISVLEENSDYPSLDEDQISALEETIKKIAAIQISSTNLYDLINEIREAEIFSTLVYFLIDDEMDCSPDRLKFLESFIKTLTIPLFRQTISIFNIGEFFGLKTTNEKVFNSLMKLISELPVHGLQYALKNKSIENLSDQDIQEAQERINQLNAAILQAASTESGQSDFPIGAGPINNNQTLEQMWTTLLLANAQIPASRMKKLQENLNTSITMIKNQKINSSSHNDNNNHEQILYDALSLPTLIDDPEIRRHISDFLFDDNMDTDSIKLVFLASLIEKMGIVQLKTVMENFYIGHFLDIKEENEKIYQDLLPILCSPDDIKTLAKKYPNANEDDDILNITEEEINEIQQTAIKPLTISLQKMAIKDKPFSNSQSKVIHQLGGSNHLKRNQEHMEISDEESLEKEQRSSVKPHLKTTNNDEETQHDSDFTYDTSSATSPSQ